MAAQSAGGKFSPASFFDQNAYTPLFASEDGSVCAGFGTVSGQSVYAVWQNGEPLGYAEVNIHIQTLELAAKTGSPVVSFYNAKGAQLEEGLQALAAASSLSEAVARLSGVVPQISVVTGICGASNAMAAASSDLVILCKEAEFFLTPAFISRAKGDSFAAAGTAKAATEAGIAAFVCDDAEQAFLQVGKLLALLPANNLAPACEFAFSAPTSTLSMQNYSADAAVASIADTDSALELYVGFGDGAKVFLATIDGSPVGLMATEGETISLTHKDTAKIARFVRFCDAFSLPIVSLLHSAGFAQSATEDVAGNIREAARLAATYADATTAKISVIAGKAVGTLYTALGNADLTIAVNGCVLSPVEPSAAVSVLQREEIEASGANIETETATRAKAWAAENASAKAAQRAGLADIVTEAASLRSSICSALTILATKRVQRLPKKHGNMPL